MRIADPRLLWLLLAAPVVVLAYAIAFAQRRRLLNRLGQPALIARMAVSVSVPRPSTMPGCSSASMRRKVPWSRVSGV